MTVIKFIGYLFGIACALFLVVAVGIGVYLGNVAKDLPDYEVLAQYTPPVTKKSFFSVRPRNFLRNFKISESG